MHNQKSRVRSLESGVKSSDESGVSNPGPENEPESREAFTTLNSGPWTPDSRLQTLDLFKSFRTPAGERLEVLRGVSFEVGAGEMLALMGASGAGKSTLLHLLGGVEAADSGRIKLCEVEITSMPRASLSRLRNERIGFVFQFHHLLPDLTATENVALPLLINRAKRGESMARAEAMLRGVSLGERLDYKVGLLSGGEQQRVALARALIREPRLVLADEPTGNLDAATGEEIIARLASFCKEQRAAVIIATHNERVAKICDRTLVLQDGKIEEVQSPRSKVQSQKQPPSAS